MKWIGIARIYDKVSGHFRCRRRVYVRTRLKTKTIGADKAPLYILRHSKIEGYRYKRIDLARFTIEMH